MRNLALIFPIHLSRLIGRRIEVVVRVDQAAALALSEHETAWHDARGDERACAEEKATTRRSALARQVIMPASASGVTIVNHVCASALPRAATQPMKIW
jgi:hypothetical protein